MSALELPTANFQGSGTLHMEGYKIEIRTSYFTPTVLGDFVIDTVWRTVPVREGTTPHGINIPVREYDRKMLDVGLLSYTAAEAHRWAILSIIDATKMGGVLCIETRLVKVIYNYSYTTEELGVSESHESMSHQRDAAFKPRYIPEQVDTKPMDVTKYNEILNQK